MARYKRKMMSEINMVPFIDVVLVLLIVFMITAPLMMQGLQVNLPKAAKSSLKFDKNNEPLIVSVTKDGLLFLNVGEREEKPIEISTLLDSIRKVLNRSPKTKVLIKGDSDVNYGKVILIMSKLQDFGITNVGLITRRGDLPE